MSASFDTFPEGALEYLIRHQHCEWEGDHGPQCPDILDQDHSHAQGVDSDEAQGSSREGSPGKPGDF